ncbi:hypothetical protein [Bosea sp. 685]|uniref:hypothetical protein n=1 Tax=Bosea sp. 685 TaxID=3080057 RepID=UPI002892A70A|nr:hypothetical protein [Bosea sp. 685]WNJ93038.1 hypothetical protein RMR04_12410 [Bosea sp. 685]
MIAPALFDDIEARLDSLIAEARLRQRRQLNVRRIGPDEVAGALAGIRRELRVWRDRAAPDAPRAPVMERRP